MERHDLMLFLETFLNRTIRPQVGFPIVSSSLSKQPCVIFTFFVVSVGSMFLTFTPKS